MQKETWSHTNHSQRHIHDGWNRVYNMLQPLENQRQDPLNLKSGHLDVLCVGRRLVMLIIEFFVGELLLQLDARMFAT